MKQIYSFEEMIPGKIYKLFYVDISAGLTSPEFDSYFIFTGVSYYRQNGTKMYKFFLVEKDFKNTSKIKTYSDFLQNSVGFTCYEM